MNTTPTTPTQPEPTKASAEEPARIQAHYANVKKLGHWTTARRFEVRARRGAVVLDLRSPLIPDGDIEIRLSIDRSMVKLLLPEDAVVDHWDLEFQSRGTVKDWSAPGETSAEASAEASGARRIRLVGEVRRGEIRVNRGGVATLAAMCSREYVSELRRVHKEGCLPTIDDPARTP